MRAQPQTWSTKRQGRLTKHFGVVTEKEEILTRLQNGPALLESLLYEALCHGYIDEKECRPSWLKEARQSGPARIV